MKEMTIDELNRCYREGNDVDKDAFSEMRSNVLLSAGEHYSKKGATKNPQIRDNTKMSSKSKLRLTKNHIYRVVKTYTNSIIAKAPGVRPTPKNESEMQDRKDAELNRAVWEDAKDRHRINDKFRMWAEEFIEVGEFALKIFWDPEQGELVGYEPKMDKDGNPKMEPEVNPETGEPIMNPVIDPVTGQPAMRPQLDEAGGITMAPVMEPVMKEVPDMDMPVMSGDYAYEGVHAFNLIRPPECKDMAKAKWLMIRKMVSKKSLKMKYKDDEEKMKYLEESEDDDYVIFDSNKVSYRTSKKEVLIKEKYIKPCMDYPRGYYYIFTQHGILEHGELPYGMFPIRWIGFDTYATNPRARSIIKVARPYQAEINRSASQEATHQITLGDDKILYQAGSKLSQGALLPGVRGVAYNGAPPTILPGRTGAQFGDYNQRTIAELYSAVFLDEVNTEKPMQLDPYTMLFRTISQKAVFKPYIQKWERFMIDICEMTLELAKYYLEDDALIAAIGKNEIVNIPEFRKTTKLCYRIKLEPISDDAETLLGKQINFQHILQYVGGSLGKDDIGKLIKNMPYVNNEDNFSDLTIDHDNATNDMLAIERGEQVQINPHDNNDYYVKKLSHRIKQPDFRHLDQQVQQSYQQLLQAHQQEMARKTQEIQRAQQGLIPTGGAMVSVDMYVPNEDPSKQPKRARIDQKAVVWLLEQLEIQGDTVERMESLEQSNMAQIAEMMNQQQQMGGQRGALQGPPQGLPPGLPPL